MALNIVDATTSEVVYSVLGAGEYALSNREVIGFGGTAGYDSTLNGQGARSGDTRGRQSAGGGLRKRRPETRQDRAVNRFGLSAGLLILFAGCASPQSIYYWGHYEDLVYTSYAEPGKADPALQIEQLEADYEVARARNLPVPPGFHAHLGVLYLRLGKLDRARRRLQAEQGQFPESAVSMQRLLSQLPR